jgi:hypothetical protein
MIWCSSRYHGVSPTHYTSRCQMWHRQRTYSELLKLQHPININSNLSGTKVRGVKPGRSRRIFRGEKILSVPSFGRKVKPSVPCRRFAACKRTLQFPWKSNCRLHFIGHFSPIVPPFVDRGLSRHMTWSASGDEGGKLKAGLVQKASVGCSTFGG